MEGKLPKDIVGFLSEEFDIIGENSLFIPIITKYHDEGGIIFRAHPCFRNERSWNDWAVFVQKTRTGKRTEVLGKMKCFVDLRQIDSDKYDKSLHAIVQFVAEPTNPSLFSHQLVTKFNINPSTELEHSLSLVPVRAIA